MSPGRFGRQPNVLMREALEKQDSERDRSLPRPVGETGRRSVGNRKERQYAATMRVSRAPKATITILLYFLSVIFIERNRLRAPLGPEGLGGFGFPPKPLWTPFPP